jgi:alpha-D-ribose 1-methylphosphonate 5-triphosphate synthase subunit PhnH
MQPSPIPSQAFQSQRRFRALMDAFARPGTQHHLGEGLEPLGAMPPAALAGLYALADFATSIHLSASLAADHTIASAIRFETSAKLVNDPASATYAVVDARSDRLALHAFHQGTPEYPDRSATIFVIIEALIGGPALEAQGPGIKDTTIVAPKGLPADFLAQWAQNRQTFPLGVDLVFCAGDRIIALPRSTRLLREAH